MSTLIGVYADWEGLNGPQYLGWLHAVSHWSTIAQTLGLSQREQDYMAPAFAKAEG